MSLGDLLGLLGRGGAGMTPERQRARMRRRADWFVTFSKDTPPGRLDVLVTAQEGCLIDVTGPVDARAPTAHPEIGSYLFACDARTSESLRAQATAAIAEARARPAVPGPPGTLSFSVGLGRKDVDDLAARASLPLQEAPPAPVAALLAAVDALVRASLEHRLRTIRAQASLGPAATGAISAEVTVVNSGTMELTFPNPAGNEPSGVTILFTGGREGEGPAPTAVATNDIQAPSRERTIELRPGAAWAFKLATRLPGALRPGTYDVAVRAKLGELDAGGPAVRGDLFVKAGALDVPRPAQERK